MKYDIKTRRHFVLHHRFLLLLLSLIISSVFIFACFRFVDFGPGKSFQVLLDGSVTEFLVNTPGCQIPSWDPWHPSVKTFYSPIQRFYKCPGVPSFLRVKSNAIVTIDETILEYYYEQRLENVRCTFQVIQRNTANNNSEIDKKIVFSSPKKLLLHSPIKEDFIKTSCTFINRKGKTVPKLTEYLALTPLKPLEENVHKTKEETAKTSQDLLNVVFLGIDSISRLNFIRHFQKTNQYLTQNFQVIDLKGYTKVGDNTFPNLVPLLTGHFHQYYKRNSTTFYDDLDFLWKHYAKAGYRTFFAEDAPTINTFNYFRRGFKNPPTHYYYRPLALALEQSNLKAVSKNHCFGSKMEMEYLYDYLKTFISTMSKENRYFAFLFLARLTHDDLNYAGYADEPTHQLFRYLNDFQLLNNTALIFFSDHGIRFGPIRKTYIGQFEERMPFMKLIFPKWFLKKHKKIYKNLKINEQRLTTPFDIHATVMNLLNLSEPSGEAVLSPAISLFNEVSSHRTCQAASISPHWCTCQIQKSLPLDDEIVILGAQTIVKQINEWTNPLRSKCVSLVLQKIHDARISAMRNKEFPKNNSSNSSEGKVSDYLIVISALPSKGLFESTVRCHIETKSCSVLDDVSRVNRYGEQSSCIDDAYLKKFCFCNTL